MTKIKFFKNENLYTGFEISGHTGYANSGADIVCSAISSISQSCCLGVIKVLKINAMMQRKDKQGYLKLSLPKKDISNANAQVLLETMFLSLNELLADYGNYINMEVIYEVF